MIHLIPGFGWRLCYQMSNIIMAGDLIAFQTLAWELFLPKIANKTERKWLESNLRPSLFRIKIILRSEYLSISLTSTNRSNLLCLCYWSALLNKKTYFCSLVYATYVTWAEKKCTINIRPSLTDVTSAIQVSEQQNKPFTECTDFLLVW